MNQESSDGGKEGAIPVRYVFYVLGALVAIMGFFGRRLMMEHERVMDTLAENRQRIVVLEKQREWDEERWRDFKTLSAEMRKTEKR